MPDEVGGHDDGADAVRELRQERDVAELHRRVRRRLEVEQPRLRPDRALDLPGVGLSAPDLVFERAGATIYLEVMGYWSRDAVWRRVELVEGELVDGLGDLAADVGRAVADASVLADRPHQRARLRLRPLHERRAPTDELVPPEEFYARYKDTFVPHLRTLLHNSPEFVWLAGKWFPRSLLVQINEGQLNIAEAVLDMNGGGPLPTEALLPELGLPAEVNRALQIFSLNYALYTDDRFDEVGKSLGFTKQIVARGAAYLLHFKKHRVAVAVHIDFFDLLHIARGASLVPDLLT